MTDITKIRNLIGDPLKADLDRNYGDGVSTTYQLARRKIKTGSVVITDADEDITVDDVDYDTGIVTLSAAVSEGSVFTLSYEFAAFTDEEIQDYLDDEGSVKNAALALLQVLMADTARRYDYSTGIEQFKPSQIFDHLQKLYKNISDGNSELVSNGGAVMKIRTTKYGNMDNAAERSRTRKPNPYIVTDA